MTTTLMPAVEVTATTPAPYSFGLGSITPTAAPDGAGAERWLGGVWWQARGCNDVGLTHNRCTVDVDVPALTPNVECSIITAPSFTVYAYSDESVGGRPVAEKRARARDILTTGEQWKAESALWTQLLAATTSEAATAATIGEAIAMAEGLIANVYGGTGTIHLSRYSATMAGLEGGAFRVDGLKLRTLLGTQVVAGGGYDTAPDETGTELSVVVTGDVKVIRGEVVDLTDSAYNERTNELSALVFRSYVIGWDCTALRVVVPAAG